MRRRRPPRRGASLAVVALLVLAVGGFSFAVARRLRVSAVEAGAVKVSATSSAFGPARAAAYRSRYAAAYHRGWVQGAARARADGRRDGRAAGQAVALRRAATATAGAAQRALGLAEISAGAIATHPTEPCIQVGGGLCEVLGPAVTGRPCPPQSLPDPRGAAVCIPQVLAQAALSPRPSAAAAQARLSSPGTDAGRGNSSRRRALSPARARLT